MTVRRSSIAIAAALRTTAVACARLVGLGDPPLVDDGAASPSPRADAGTGDAVPGGDVASAADATAAADANADAGPDGGDADRAAAAGPPCDPGAPFGTPLPVGSLNTDQDEFDARFTEDELTVYFARSIDAPGTGNLAVYVATRRDVNTSFGPATTIPVVDVAFTSHFAPSITHDGLALYFNERPDTSGATMDIWVAHRTSANGPFSEVEPVAHVNSARNNANPIVTPDESALYFYSDRSGQKLIYVAARTTTGEFGPPASIPAIDSDEDGNVAVNADQTTIAFSSTRTPRRYDDDIWISHRADTSSDWSPPVNVAEVNSYATDNPTWLSPDGCRMYIQSDRDGADFDIYVATRARSR